MATDSGSTRPQTGGLHTTSSLSHTSFADNSGSAPSSFPPGARPAEKEQLPFSQSGITSLPGIPQTPGRSGPLSAPKRGQLRSYQDYEGQQSSFPGVAQQSPGYGQESPSLNYNQESPSLQQMAGAYPPLSYPQSPSLSQPFPPDSIRPVASEPLVWPPPAQPFTNRQQPDGLHPGPTWPTDDVQPTRAYPTQQPVSQPLTGPGAPHSGTLSPSFTFPRAGLQPSYQAEMPPPAAPQMPLYTLSPALDARLFTPSQVEHKPAGRKRKTLVVGIMFLFLCVLLSLGGYALFLKPDAGSRPVPKPVVRPLPTLAPLTTTDPHDLYNQATGRRPILVDSLRTQGDNDWEPLNTTGNCTFKANALHAVGMEGDKIAICATQIAQFKNIAFQAQVVAQQGDTAGLAFRADSQGHTLYLFSVSTDGLYTLAVVDGQRGLQTHILAGGNNPAIKQGLNQPNVLTVIARTNTIYLYVNNQFITQLDDPTNSKGIVGVFAGDSQGNASEAAFSKVKVWSV